MVAITGGKCLLISAGVSHGHDLKNFFEIAVENVDLTGEKQAACKYEAKSVWVCFFLIMTAKDGVCGDISAFKYFSAFCLDDCCKKASRILWSMISPNFNNSCLKILFDDTFLIALLLECVTVFPFLVAYILGWMLGMG